MKLYPGVDRPAGRQGPGARSTSSCAARAPRARTSAPAAPCASGTPHEIATEVSINTALRRRAHRARRVRARRRAAASKVTLVHKTNVLVHAGQPVAADVRRGRGGVPRRRDRLLPRRRGDRSSSSRNPERFDVIVTDNLFGDILTDIGAAIAGGIGLAASGNIDPSRAQPEHVRAGARLGARHRRAGQGRPDRHGPVRGDAARPPRRGRGRRLGRGGGGRRPRRARRRRAQHRRRSATPSPRE